MLSTTCLSVRSKRLLSIAALPTLMITSWTVTAQEAKPEGEANQLEEIVVTGTSLARSVLDTPFAATTFDENRLAKLTANSQADILNSVPTIKAEGGGGEVATNVFINGLPSGGNISSRRSCTTASRCSARSVSTPRRSTSITATIWASSGWSSSAAAFRTCSAPARSPA